MMFRNILSDYVRKVLYNGRVYSYVSFLIAKGIDNKQNDMISISSNYCFVVWELTGGSKWALLSPLLIYFWCVHFKKICDKVEVKNTIRDGGNTATCHKLLYTAKHCLHCLHHLHCFHCISKAPVVQNRSSHEK